MSKSIELTPIQIKALKSGATMFIFPIKLQGFTMLERNEFKPNFVNDYSWQPTSKMTKEQSRYSFNECIDIKIVRVQEINIKDIPKIQTEMWMFDDWYNQQMKEQNINRTYEDNDYVFLVEFKRS